MPLYDEPPEFVKPEVEGLIYIFMIFVSYLFIRDGFKKNKKMAMLLL